MVNLTITEHGLPSVIRLPSSVCSFVFTCLQYLAEKVSCVHLQCSRWCFYFIPFHCLLENEDLPFLNTVPYCPYLFPETLFLFQVVEFCCPFPQHCFSVVPSLLLDNPVCWRFFMEIVPMSMFLGQRHH